MMLKGASEALSPFEAAMKETCVLSWLGEVNSESRPSYKTKLGKWLIWLWKKPEWAGKMPSALLNFQENAVGRDRMTLPKLIIEYVQERGGTYKSMSSYASGPRSFFLHSTVDMPMVHWVPRPTKEPVKGHLVFEQVRNIILHADPRNTAIFLTMLQGLMDLERFKRFNLKYAMPLAKHLREESLDEPFRIDFPYGRKTNPRPFYTFIYHDALVAWKNYLDQERGWPENDKEALALTDDGTPPDKPAIRAAFRTIAERLHYRPETPKGQMSGVAPHEAFRDVVRSHLRLAKAEGFDLTCAEFWMGHSIDSLNYEKFTDLEPEYMMKNVRLAAPYLNIITNEPRNNEKEHAAITILQATVEGLSASVMRLEQNATRLGIVPGGEKQK
jgi:hypothetical protein